MPATPSRRLARGAVNAVIAAGLLLAVSPLLQNAYGWWSQRQLRAQWEAASASSVPRRAASRAAKTPAPARPSSRKGAASAITLSGQGGARKSAPWPAARLRIAEIGVDAIVVQGLDEKALARGPAHDPASALPGEDGNCVLAGHRNVYGAWFYKLDQLWAGSVVELSARGQTHRYAIAEVKTVAESDSSVLRSIPGAPPALTLITCTLPHSPFRLVATAYLQEDEAPSLADPE